MAEEKKIVVHSYVSNDCSKGHKYTIKFLSRGARVNWVKVCRRCGKTDEGTHKFEE